jgi:hypothetical protein
LQEYDEERRAYHEELKRNPPPPRPPRTWQEMEESSDRAMLEGMQSAIEQRFLETTVPAVHDRVFGRSPRPRLAATNESPAVTERQQRAALYRRKIFRLVGV